MIMGSSLAGSGNLEEDCHAVCHPDIAFARTLIHDLFPVLHTSTYLDNMHCCRQVFKDSVDGDGEHLVAAAMVTISCITEHFF
jgi:hypothetical protein